MTSIDRQHRRHDARIGVATLVPTVILYEDAAGGMTMNMARDQAKLERLTFFSDAVFAIAMTLLVIEVRLPDGPIETDRALAQALLDLLPNYIGFVVSFLVIGRFWTGHHRLMAMIDVASPALIRANLLLLMAIAFMPFPTAVLSDHSLLRVAIGCYAGYLLIVGLANMWVVTVALRDVSARGPRAGEARQIRRSMWSPVIIAACGLAAGMIAPAAGLTVLIVVTPLVILTLQRVGTRRDAIEDDVIA